MLLHPGFWAAGLVGVHLALILGFLSEMRLDPLDYVLDGRAFVLHWRAEKMEADRARTWVLASCGLLGLAGLLGGLGKKRLAIAVLCILPGALVLMAVWRAM